MARFDPATGLLIPESVNDDMRNAYGDTQGNRMTAGGFPTMDYGRPPGSGGAPGTSFGGSTSLYQGAAPTGVPDAGVSNIYGNKPMAMPNGQAFGGSQSWGAANGAMTTGTPAAGSGSNPYLGGMADAITSRVNNNFNNNLLPAIRGQAISNGQFGGSRQGVAEGLAAGQSQEALTNGLANLFGQQSQFDATLGNNRYQFDQTLSNNRDQFGATLGNNRYQFDNNLASQNRQFDANLGLGYANNELNSNTANQNFYTAQRGQDLQQYQIGSGLYNAGVNGQLGLGQGQYNVGNTAMQAPVNWANNYGNQLSQFSGLGGQQVTTQNGGGNNFGQIAGGALAGAQVGSNLWSSYQPSPTNYGTAWGGTQGGLYNNPSAM